MTKEMYYSLPSLNMTSYVLFPALPRPPFFFLPPPPPPLKEQSMNFNLSKMVYYM